MKVNMAWTLENRREHRRKLFWFITIFPMQINIRIFKKKNHSKVNRSIQNFGLKHVYFHLQMFTPCSRQIAYVLAVFTPMFPCSRQFSRVHVSFTSNFKCSRRVHVNVPVFTSCSRQCSRVHAFFPAFTPMFPRSRLVHVSFTPFLVFTHVHACSRAWIGNVNVAGIVHIITWSNWIYLYNNNKICIFIKK